MGTDTRSLTLVRRRDVVSPRRKIKAPWRIKRIRALGGLMVRAEALPSGCAYRQP